MDFADRTFPVENIPYMWYIQDFMTVDGIPYIGHFTKDTPNLYIATGFDNWIWQILWLVISLQDLITKGHSPWEDFYNPSRNTIVASTKSFVIKNLNVSEKLIRGKISLLSDNIDIKKVKEK